MGSRGLRAGARMMLMMPFRCISKYFTFAQSFWHFCIHMYVFIYLFIYFLPSAVAAGNVFVVSFNCSLWLFLVSIFQPLDPPPPPSPHSPHFPCLLFMPQSFLGPWASACWQLCKVTFWVSAYDYLNSCPTLLYRFAPISMIFPEYVVKYFYLGFYWVWQLNSYGIILQCIHSKYEYYSYIPGISTCL